MKDIYLVRYSVKGIKTLKELVTLSFYKKTFAKNMDTRGYNVKGIYGMNGSGKSAIITSVNILKNLLVSSEYLNNMIVQKSLEEIINKEIRELFIEADYVIEDDDYVAMFRYTIRLKKDTNGKYVIAYEHLAKKKANAQDDSMKTIFEVEDGELLHVKEEDKFLFSLAKKTINLLESSSMCALFQKKFFFSGISDEELRNDYRFFSIAVLHIFGRKLHVYMDNSDDHTDFLLENSIRYYDNLEDSKSEDSADLMKEYYGMDNDFIDVLSISTNVVFEKEYSKFERRINKLYEFLHIFKSDLRGIEIDKKQYKDAYVCSLLMVYDSYKIHGEFESTGIKKLVKIFAYLEEMVRGEIVFIDEFDSNLHDVYLCALLEYLMEYGEGQLCFTTHNVGPMDILKRNKKSIDFLSEDQKIYPWKNSGNYSPSRLYRNGMIEGSPFNIDSIDFIGIFNEEEEDE